MGVSIKKIKQNNEPSFLFDIKRVHDVMVYCGTTRKFFKVRKGEVLKYAESNEIRYCITNQIFKVVRDSMVII